MQTTVVIVRDHLLVQQLVQAGDAGGAGGLAAEAVAGDHRAVFEDLFVGHFADDAVHDVQRRSALGRFTGRLISMALAMVCGVIVGFIHGGVELLGDCDASQLPSFQRQSCVGEECVERVGAGGVDDRKPRDLFDQAQLFQLHERLAEGRAVAEVSAGHDDPVRRLPVAALRGCGT